MIADHLLDRDDLDRELPPALARIRSRSGVSLAFGGVVGSVEQVVLRHFDGPTVGALADVAVGVGQGLGGKVIRTNRVVAVDDYLRTDVISHRYDRIIAAEGLHAMVAVPVIVQRRPVAVVYGALRNGQSVGARILDLLTDEVRALEQQLAVSAARRSTAERTAVIGHERLRDAVSQAYADLRVLASRVDDPRLRATLLDVTESLSATRDESAHVAGAAVQLTRRERDVLSLVALGYGNAELGTALGLSVDTVKSYLKSAMQKLGARTRAQAVVSARRAGQLV
ncbi:LuxR C-terminal-related transcriptional regulator [Williamsia sterculiae]|uniref:GAF domain-containing protein n=1 Tax=Williamsia sterculiae TaxID=1344003 RepID=A0A1N7DX00_9NOCA|nr:LuxR C-terminal-related transcriptional regulator [Williamsia sterculiae]SIR80354.1 GAF domain-containing protein [Williamsia sterculiae]